MTNIFLYGRGGSQIVDPLAYTPMTLPALPRRHCPYECQRTVQRYGSKQDMYVVKAACTAKPLANGWCAAHQHAQELLEAGARLGYPCLQINSALSIGAGLANWEAYALCYLPRRREQVMWALKELERRKEQEQPAWPA